MKLFRFKNVKNSLSIAKKTFSMNGSKLFSTAMKPSFSKTLLTFATVSTIAGGYTYFNKDSGFCADIPPEGNQIKRKRKIHIKNNLYQHQKKII